MRHLVFKLARFLPLLILVATINYFVDPSQLFANGRIERNVVSYMLAGKNVANLINYDHRLLQKYYIQQMSAKDIIIMGSSRAMLIHETYFPNRTFYNASLAGTSVEDYIGVYAMLKKRGVIPSTVLVEVSPWVFNAHSGQTRWKTISGDYFDGLNLLKFNFRESRLLASIDLEKYAQMLSLSYLQESLKWMTRPQSFYATDEINTGEVMKLHDGSRIYEEEKENISQAELSSIIRQSLIAPYGLENFSEIDQDIKLQFESLLNYIKDQGSQVILVLVPYHSNYFNSLLHSPEYSVINDVENYLHHFADIANLEIIGSYNPEVVGCFPSEFYDGLHPKRTCIDKLMNLRNH